MTPADDGTNPGGENEIRLPLAALVLLSVAGSLFGAVVFALTGSGTMIVPWIILSTVVTLFNVAALVRARRRENQPTGAALTPRAGPTLAPLTAWRMRWIGGANTPGRIGRTFSTAPLAVLELLDESRLVLRIRPAVLARLFGKSTRWVLDRADGTEVFPARGMLGARGLGLKRPDRATLYFWTPRREEILSVLANRGFPVSWEERHFRP